MPSGAVAAGVPGRQLPPFDGPGEPVGITGVLDYLAGPDARSVRGRNLPVHGGATRLAV
ncbi:hypothetical protein ACFV3E_43445 [Streptomyces sp. NPDC059718]